MNICPPGRLMGLFRILPFSVAGRNFKAILEFRKIFSVRLFLHRASWFERDPHLRAESPVDAVRNGTATRLVGAENVN